MNIFLSVFVVAVLMFVRARSALKMRNKEEKTTGVYKHPGCFKKPGIERVKTSD